jgi:hypothetical protein
MIHIRNVGDFPIVMKIKGTLTTTSYDYSQPLPFTGVIKAVWAYEATPGTGGTESVDLVLGSSVAGNATLVSSGTLFSFATTAATPTYNTSKITTTAQNPPAVTKGQILGVTVSTVHTTTAGADLVVVCVIERARDGAIPAAMQTSSYGYDSDAIN